MGNWAGGRHEMNTSFGSMDHRRSGLNFFPALTLEVLRSTPLPFLEFNSFQEFHSFLRRSRIPDDVLLRLFLDVFLQSFADARCPDDQMRAPPQAKVPDTPARYRFIDLKDVLNSHMIQEAWKRQRICY